jgi:methionyl-tRNA formyltransferase
MKYGFAGDRLISVNLLSFLIDEGYKPSFLIVNETKDSSHREELISLSGLTDRDIYDIDFINKNYSILADYDTDYIFGIHFPYIISKPLLSIPKVGFLNLHPAFLPYNKGWHTPSWAILDKTKYGATLHFMSNDLDAGDIITQTEIEVKPNVTANELYQSVLEVEEQLFKDSFTNLLTLKPTRTKQVKEGTSYNKRDLAKVQKIDLNEKIFASDLIDKLRALTTNNIEEAAYFIVDEKKYRVQVNIIPE